MIVCSTTVILIPTQRHFCKAHEILFHIFDMFQTNNAISGLHMVYASGFMEQVYTRFCSCFEGIQDFPLWVYFLSTAKQTQLHGLGWLVTRETLYGTILAQL